MQNLGAEVGKSTEASGAPGAVPFDDSVLEDSGFVEFATTGTVVSGEFRCTDCGYGAVVHRALPRCPMCSGTVWESCGPLAARLAD